MKNKMIKYLIFILMIFVIELQCANAETCIYSGTSTGGVSYKATLTYSGTKLEDGYKFYYEKGDTKETVDGIIGGVISTTIGAGLDTFKVDTDVKEKFNSMCPNLYIKTEFTRGAIILTSKNGIGGEDSAFDQVTPTSSGATEESSDPIIESTKFSRNVENYTLTFAKTQSGKYYLQVAYGVNKNSITFESSATDINVPLEVRSTSFNHKIKSAEIDSMWNARNETIHMFDAQNYVIYFSLEQQLDSYNNTGNSQSNINVTVTDPTKSSKPRRNLGNICKYKSTKKVMRFIGYILYIIKIAVPIVLLYSGIMAFAKALLDGESDSLGKSAKSFGIRMLIAIIIFFIPTIVDTLFTLVEKDESGFTKCRTCIFKPNSCKVNEGKE